METIALVGSTGFVGSNILAGAGAAVTHAFHSTDIASAYGTRPDLLIYAGLRAEKFLANSAPEKDMALIAQAEENIRRIAPGKLVLISTIDVFRDPRGVDENSPVDTCGLHPYGYDRYQLECWARDYAPDALILRLPGLFGRNLKKNFIYDFIHRIPSMLKQEKFRELSAREPGLADWYSLQDNGFYRVKPLTAPEEAALKAMFERLGFSALNFTDSRSAYQFYPLDRLWGDICLALRQNLRLLHLATEPVTAGEVYSFLTGETFRSELPAPPAFYDYRTVHGELFGGEKGYLLSKTQVLEEIRRFVNRNS